MANTLVTELLSEEEYEPTTLVITEKRHMRDIYEKVSGRIKLLEVTPKYRAIKHIVRPPGSN